MAAFGKSFRARRLPHLAHMFRSRRCSDSVYSLGTSAVPVTRLAG